MQKMQAKQNKFIQKKNKYGVESIKTMTDDSLKTKKKRSLDQFGRIWDFSLK